MKIKYQELANIIFDLLHIDETFEITEDDTVWELMSELESKPNKIIDVED